MEATVQGPSGVLADLSDQLAAAVARAAPSVVRVDGRASGPASGVLLTANGLAVTADHTLERPEGIKVCLGDGRSVPAVVVGRDPSTDVALLRLEAGGLTPIPRTPGEHGPRVGHTVLIVARPGDQVAVSSGVVSALDGPIRTWGGRGVESVIRTDAAFYPGFSGGAMVDVAGQFLGLATSRFGPQAGAAIPVTIVEQVVQDLVSHGRLRRGYVGLTGQPAALPAPWREQFGLGQEQGLLITRVDAGGPADKAGLLAGDVLVNAGGQAVQRPEDLLAVLGAEQVGRGLPLRLIRGGAVRTLSAVVAERRSAAQ